MMTEFICALTLLFRQSDQLLNAKKQSPGLVQALKCFFLQDLMNGEWDDFSC